MNRNRVKNAIVSYQYTDHPARILGKNQANRYQLIGRLDSDGIKGDELLLIMTANRATLDETADLLRKLGVKGDIMTFDGGSSTYLFNSRKGNIILPQPVNQEDNPTFRKLPHYLGFRTRGKKLISPLIKVSQPAGKVQVSLLKPSIEKMLNRITSSIATCTIFGFIATFCPPLYGTDRVMAQSPRVQDELSKLRSEVSKRGKSPEDVNRAMRDKFPNSSFPYYEPANGCSTPKGISWGWGNNDLFKSACDNHDICYTTPGNPKGYCDRKMLSEMFKICENGSFLCKSWARDYYSAVNLGAQDAYDTAQKQEGEYIKSVYAWLNSMYNRIDLTGNWTGEGYGCERGGLVEKIQITVNGNYLVAKKITGDNCVPAGNITFQGTLPELISEGSSFPVSWTVGTPTNPASGKTVQDLTVLNTNSFSSYGVKFTRVTR